MYPASIIFIFSLPPFSVREIVGKRTNEKLRFFYTYFACFAPYENNSSSLESSHASRVPQITYRIVGVASSNKS